MFIECSENIRIEVYIYIKRCVLQIISSEFRNSAIFQSILKICLMNKFILYKILKQRNNFLSHPLLLTRNIEKLLSNKY